MIRLVVFASLLISCRMSLEEEDPVAQCEISMTQSTCVGADGKSDLTWLQTNVFGINCGSTSCHGASASPGGGLDMKDKTATYMHLVNASSTLDPTRKLVVPGNVEKSYLMVMIRGVPPGMADPPAQAPALGYMPKGDPKGLCCQKIDAVERWIMAGAQNN
jgi:hypothetical protein